MSNPMLSDYSAELEPGDAVLLYTDGLTDAYAPERIVSQEELVVALGRYAGRAAATIAAGVQGIVLNGRAESGREPRDDITILVLRVPERA
jgi:serine phosphatase RsbU (regulator of sigma subunit)